MMVQHEQVFAYVRNWHTCRSLRLRGWCQQRLEPEAGRKASRVLGVQDCDAAFAQHGLLLVDCLSTAVPNDLSAIVTLHHQQSHDPTFVESLQRPG